MKLRGSYTVEASVIIAFCMIVFGVAVGISYDIFKESMEYVSTAEDEIDVVRLFRTKESISDIVEGLGIKNGD